MLRIETGAAITILFFAQAVLAAVLWYWTGDADLPTRIMTALLPFLLLPALYVVEFVQTPPRMHAEATALVEAAEKALSDSADAKPKPDWAIGDLFRHVDPSATDENSPACKRIGQEVLDRLAIGQLDAWGRRNRSGGPATLVLIRREYWETAEWTYFFLGASGREAELVHTTLPSTDRRDEDYRDVRVNKRQALQLWPAGPDLGSGVGRLQTPI